jgi:hypothetical protein
MRQRALVIAVIAALCATAYAAGKTKVVETKGVKARGDGSDDNVKNATDKNDPNSNVEAPPEKGGPKKRGACGLAVDNRTRWVIRIYVDGYYRGTVGAWGDLGRLVTEGWPTTVYARADFTDGSALTWGPQRFDCEAGEVYTWHLD